ncbi:pernisine [Aeropyrum pernix]|uniref:Pernisine n=1 Tax=Aeropyrum pernix TaxID=56636 RepID=A0A401H7C3_AERPX|nr:pernisine [Aeropyrum pernix]
MAAVVAGVIQVGTKIAAIAIALIFILPLFPVYTGSAAGASTVVIAKINPEEFNPKAVEALQGKVIYVADLAPVAIISIPGKAVGLLSKLPGVVSVSEDGVVQVMAKPPWAGGGNKSQPAEVLPWGVDYIDAELVWPDGVTGWVDVNGDGDGEIEVAVIDTGVDKDHPDLAGNIIWGISVSNGRISSNYQDRNGHGTHVTGTVAAIDNDIGVIGVAHSVEIYAVKALGNGGYGSWSDLVIAIDLAVKGPDGVIDADGDGVVAGDPDDDAPEVISMSLGGSSPPPELHDVIKAAYNLGITIVAAAGNDGADSPSYPAAYPEVIAVGAIDENGNVPSWSNRSPEVAAPGVNILSTYPDDTYEELSGTSMATPHVSGTVALIQAARLAAGLPLLPPGSESDTTPDTVRGVLHITATDAGDPGYDSLYGYGIIDAYDAVQAAVSS